MSELNSAEFNPDVAPTEEDAAYAKILKERELLREQAKKLRMHEDDLDVFLRNGIRPEVIARTDTQSRRAMLAHLRKTEQLPPKWLMISQLWPGMESYADERRSRLRHLYNATVLLVRRALARHEADPLKGERSIFWDPIAEVCHDLEIAPSKLSALCKEFSGHSLIQVIDCVRVERVRKLMRRELREFVRGFQSERSTTGASLATKTGAGAQVEPVETWMVWKALKRSRKWPEFSQDIWANSMGFSTYRRLYRACVAVYGKTPHMIEIEIIQELLKSGEATTKAGEREWNLKEDEAAVREIQSVATVDCRPEEQRRE